MQTNFKKITVLFSDLKDFREIKELPAKKVFDDEVCSFLNNLSVLIRKDSEAKRYPDIVTFGFFCRRANIENLKKDYYQDFRIGRGLSFHIAPSNVPINFAYSMITGLLAGNSCVVRVSTKEFAQTNILCRLIKAAVRNECSDIGKYIAIIQYERDKEINDYLSLMADIRVIWGGDKTIAQLRESRIPTRCVEITFADRYSLCVLNAVDILKMNDWEKIAQNFYNDTYLYDQNACSSPRLMYWIGDKDEIKAAKELFWRNVYRFITKKYTIEPSIAVDKLMMDFRLAIELEHIRIEKDCDNLFHRIHLSSLVDNLNDYTCPGGSFLEYDSDSMDALLSIVDKKFQTLSYMGGDGRKIAEWVEKSGVPGIDRVVPMGKTADFTLTWDGYDLVKTMSRKIYYN